MPLVQEKLLRRRATSLRRRIIFQNGSHSVVARAWPRPRRTPTTHDEHLWREYFRLVQRSFQYAHQRERQFYIQLASTGPWLPRDWWTSNMYRRLFWFDDQFGTLYPIDGYLMTNRNLDFITDQPGSMLFRGPDGWIAIPPGSQGETLTYISNSTPPVWQKAGGGGGGGYSPLRVDPFEISVPADGGSIETDLIGRQVWISPLPGSNNRRSVKGTSPITGNEASFLFEWCGTLEQRAFVYCGLWYPTSGNLYGCRVAMEKNTEEFQWKGVSTSSGPNDYSTTGDTKLTHPNVERIVRLRIDGDDIVAELVAVKTDPFEIYRHTGVVETSETPIAVLGDIAYSDAPGTRGVTIKGFQYE